MDDQQFMEGIDACRPGREDHVAPELAAEMADLAERLASDPAARRLYERSQRFDARLARQLQDGPVPGDLASRLLARLAESDVTGTTPSVARETELVAVAPASNAAQEQPSTSAARWSRRRVLGTFGALAASLVLAAFGARAVWPSKGSPNDPADAVAIWQDKLSGKWQAMTKAPQGYAFPSVVRASARGWQWVDNRTVAFQLTPPGGVVATLYVTRQKLFGMPSGPPAVPQSSTGGRAIGSWRSGETVYFLVIEGDQRDYQRLIKSTAAPLA